MDIIPNIIFQIDKEIIRYNNTYIYTYLGIKTYYVDFI